MTVPKASDIRVGDHLHLNDAPLGLEFTILPEGEVGREVVVVAHDFIVLLGEGALLSTRVPKYLLSAPRPASEPRHDAA
jgi:hypothetical protein